MAMYCSGSPVILHVLPPTADVHVVPVPIADPDLVAEPKRHEWHVAIDPAGIPLACARSASLAAAWPGAATTVVATIGPSVTAPRRCPHPQQQAA